ncbi:MAG: hypothetical protein KAR19_05895 [Bacteroidales bacterium]|nr:hypothetical protein [Bacteroidales bacterium]
MKKSALVISYLFHPLFMPTLGLLLLLNSGTYISLLDPAAKRAILFVMALGTLFFPLIMVPVLYYRNLITKLQNSAREERLILRLIILILYIITFVYFVRLPLSRIIHAYVLSITATLFMLLLLGVRFKLCSYSAGLGGLTGLIIALILLYDTPLQGFLMLTLLAAGLTGTARLVLGIQRPGEVYTGYLLGFTVVLVTLLVY